MVTAGPWLARHTPKTFLVIDSPGWEHMDKMPIRIIARVFVLAGTVAVGLGCAAAGGSTEDGGGAGSKTDGAAGASAGGVAGTGASGAAGSSAGGSSATGGG